MYVQKGKEGIEWEKGINNAGQRILKGTFCFNDKKYKITVSYAKNQDIENLMKSGLERVRTETLATFVGQKILCSNLKEHKWSLEDDQENEDKQLLHKNVDSVAQAFREALSELSLKKSDLSETEIKLSPFKTSLSIKEQPSYVSRIQTKKGRGREKTDKRIFAQFHASHLIGKTKFEGGRDYENTKAMHNVVDSLCPHLSGDDQKIMQETSQFLKSKYEMEKGVAGYFSTAGNLYSKICSGLDKGESVYTSGGWNDYKSSGHCAAVKFYKKGDQVCFYILNRGAGSEYHSVLKDVSGGKTKQDIRSDIYTMSLDEFKGEKGKGLVQALHELRHPERVVSWISRAWAHIKDFFTGFTQDYFKKLFETRLKLDAQDAYGVCEFFKEGVSAKDEIELQKYAATSQIAGNCTQTTLNACLLDYLLDKGFSRERVNRLMFLVKQQSLENAYEDWQKEPDSEMRLLLRDAAKQHLIRVAKNPSLSKEEKDSAWNLANTILKNVSEEQLSSVKIPDNVECSEIKSLSKQVNLANISPEGNKQILLKGQPAVSEIAKLDAPKTVKEVSAFLKKTLELARKVETEKGDLQRLFVDLTGTVDCLSPDGKEFWALGSKEECQAVLEQIDAIGAFLMELRNKIEKNEDVIDRAQFEQTMAILYEISIHLADQIFPTLKNYRVALPPIFKSLDEMSLSKRKRMLKIQENLAERAKGIGTVEQWKKKLRGLIKTDFRNELETKTEASLFEPRSFKIGEEEKDPFGSPEERFLNDLNPQYGKKLSEIYEQEAAKDTYEDQTSSRSVMTWKALHEKACKENNDYRRLLCSIARSIQPSANTDVSQYFKREKEGINFFNPPSKNPRPGLLSPNETDFSDGSENSILAESQSFKTVIPGVSNQKLMELTQIMISPETAPMKMIAWLGQKSNLKLLAHPRIRKTVEKCLFSLGNLEKMGDKNKELFQKHFNSFQEMLPNVFNASSLADEKTLEAYLSALRINESVKEVAQCDIKVETKEEMEMLLVGNLPLNQKQLVATAYLSRFVDFPVEGSEKTFLIAFFIYKTSLRAHNELSLRAENAINLHHEKAWTWAQENPEIASLILAKKGSQPSVEDGFIQFAGFKLHSTGVIEALEKESAPLPHFIMQSPLYKEYFGVQQPTNFEQKQGFLKEVGGNHRLLIKENGSDLSSIDKEFKIGEKAVWGRYQSKENLEEILKKTSLSPLFFSNPNKTFLEVGSSSPRIFIVDGSGSLIYHVSSEGKISNVQGEEITLLNTLKDGNWKTFCEHLDDSKYVNIGVKDNKMHSFEFARLGLHFDLTEKGWESKQYPGFFIAKPQEPPFRTFKGGLIIKNARGEEKLLMPFHPFEDRLKKNKSLLKQKRDELNKTESKDRKKVLEKEVKELKQKIKSYKKETNRCFETNLPWDQNTQDSTIPCFVYEKKGEQWNSENPQGSLYMSLLFRSEKNYIKAKEQLDRVSSPLGLSKIDLLIEKELWKKEDLSPEGVAFDLHFHLRILDQDKKFVKDVKLDPKERKELENLKNENAKARNERLEGLQTCYRNLQSDRVEYINQIPEALRLSNRQKQDLGDLTGLNNSVQVDVLTNYSYISSLQSEEFSREIEMLNVSIMNPLWRGTKDKKSEDESEGLLLKIIQNKMIPHVADFDPNKICPVMGKSDKKIPGTDISFPPIHAYLIKNFDSILKAAASEKTREKTFRHLQFLARYFNKKGTSGRELHLLLCLACCMEPTALNTVLSEKTSEKKAEKLISLVQKHGKVQSGDDEEVLLLKENPLYTALKKPFEVVPLQKPSIDKISTIKAKREIVKNKIENISVSKLEVKIGKKNVIAPMGEFYVDCQFKEEKLSFNRELPSNPPEELFAQAKIKEEKDPQVKKKMEELNEAYQKVKTNGSSAYSSYLSLKEMESKITGNLNQAKTDVIEKRTLALKKANTMLEADNKSKRRGEQFKKITETDLAAAYLRQDFGTLQSQNPELTSEKAKEIFELMMEADLAEYKVKQCEEMQEIINSKIDENQKKQRLAEISLRQFDPEILQKYPQLSVYVAATGLWPRQDQIEAIDWAVKSLIEGKPLTHAQARMLERSAGFGKTKIFTVVVAQIMASRGFLTTVVNIANLYDFGKKDLSDSLRGAFMQNIELIEWGLKDLDKIDQQKLEELAEKMDQWKELGHVVYIKPETWHVINLIKKRSSEKTQKAAEAVLNRIGKGLVLADEGHIAFSPLTEVNRSEGEKKSVPKEQVEDFLEDYMFLAKQKDLGLKDNQQSGADEKVISRIQQDLIGEICKRQPFNSYNGISEWLKKPMGTEPPKWLETILKEDSALFNRIEVQHRFVQGLMQSMMKKRGKIDVGIHSNPKIDYAVPRRDKEETGASYSDAVITLASTIQVIMQEGVQRDTFQNFLEKQLDMHRKELDESFEDSPEPTAIEKKFSEMLGTRVSLDGLLLGSTAEENLYNQLKSNEKFLKWIIEEHISPQIVEYSHKYTSTPAEFLNGCQQSIVFTATAGSIDTYPTAFVEDKKQHQLDLEAQAIDIAHMLSKRNSKVVLIDPFQSEKEFFEQISKQGVDCEKVQFIIDRGGVFRNTKDNQDIINGMNDVLKSKKPGIIVKEVQGERQAYFVDNNIPPKITPLEGSNFEKAMKLAKLDPEKLKEAVHVFTIDLCTGTDWKLRDEECLGIFTIGEDTTLSQGIQAGKRDRKMRMESHQFTWVSPKNIKDRIKPSEDLTPTDIVYWLVQNQVKEEAQLTTSSFDQGVDALFVRLFPEKTASVKVLQSPSDKAKQQEFLRKYKENPLLGQIVWKLHAIGLVSQEKLEEVKPGTIKSVEDVNKFLEEQDRLMRREVIELKRLVERTQKVAFTDLSTVEKEEQREMEVEQQREKDEQKEKIEDGKPVYSITPRREAYVEDQHSLKALAKGALSGKVKEGWDIFKPMQKDWPKSLKGPTLHLSIPFSLFARDGWVNGIRPSDQMLVMCDEKGENPEFIPISARGLKYYYEQMENKVEGKKFAIVDIKGKVLFSQMNTESNEKLEKSKDLKQACTLLSLSKGEIRGSKETLQEVFGELSEEDFKLLGENIKERIVGPGAKFEQIKYDNLKNMFHPQEKK